MSIGARIGARIGANIGATIGQQAIGSSVTPAPTRDGPQSVYVPTLAAQWPLINAAFPTPSWHFPMQESAGNLVDVLNGFQRTPAAGAGGSYGATIAGWATKFLAVTEVANTSWGSVNATGDSWNVFTQSVFVYGLVRFSSSSGTRRWFVLNGTTHYLEVLVNGHLRIDGGTAGLVSHVGATVHPFVVEFIAGAGVLGHTGPGLYRVTTDLEQVVGTWSQVPDSTKGSGPVSAAAAAPMVGNYGDETSWGGTDAETLSTFGPGAFMRAVGWTVAGGIA